MRVMLISFSELPTMQRYLYLLSGELDNAGIANETIGSANITIDTAISSRNRLVNTPDTPRPTFQSFSMMKKAMREIVAHAKAFNPDCIHFTNKHTWNYFALLELKRALKGVKFVHTFHDPVGHNGDSIQKGVILYHRVVQRHLDAVVVHSNIAERQTVERLKPKCKVFQAPLGVTEWHDYQEPPQTSSEALIFGRLNSYKGLAYYPDILDELYAIDPGIHVTIAGKASDDVDKGLLSEIGARPNCTLKNAFVEEGDIDGLFEAASVVLVPYTSITQSGVILDAYSRSRSVIAFDIDGIEQYVPDSESRVRAYDCKSYAMRVNSRVRDKGFCEKKNREAWLYGKEHFSPACMASSLCDIYSTICSV